MPTENRSSNTEMVSVPRAHLQAWQERFSKAQMFKQSTEVQAALAQPAPQPHAEPIAWMVGTAFWWTKEEAERDAAETGLPIVGLGPMAGVAPAEQHQGEPVALPARKDPTRHWVEPGGVHKAEGWNSYHDEIAKLGPLYTRPAPANSAEVEREPECFCVEHGLHIETLRAQLAEAQAKGDLLNDARVKAEELQWTAERKLAEAHALLRKLYDNLDLSLGGYREDIGEMLSASAEPGAPAVPRLPELTDDLREILGRPNFTCHFIAKALRLMGLSIAPKSEDEQAVVIHWLMGHYLKHGADWRRQAEAELKAASEKLNG